MSRRIAGFITATIILLFTGVTAQAQGRVTTRKYRLADFTDKVTQVVLSGNELLSGALKEEVMNAWTASAFEFCSLEQFEAWKTQDRYYFLMIVETRMKGEETPGLVFLTLVKGGPEAAESIGEMNEVISLPLCPAPGGTGRELIYLGGLVKAIQEFTLAAMESEKVAYSGTDWFNGHYKRFGKQKQLYISKDDLAPSVTGDVLVLYQDSDFFVEPEDEVDRVYVQDTYNTLTSYVVAPLFPAEKGSYCYKMLFESGTQTLYYITRHKITPKNGTGFLADDLKKLARKR